METEQKLADILFGNDPIAELRNLTDPHFEKTDQKQFAQFHARLLKRIDERLSQQFGACLALIEEWLGKAKAQTMTSDFVTSAEYRLVREDITNLNQTSESRFEIAFLHFILRTQSENPAFLTEFSEIYLRELALS